jgi:hypothetical protein
MMDGGLGTFIPQPRQVDYTVKVCCFPTRHLAYAQSRARNLKRVKAAALLEVDVSPDTFSAWPREYGGWLGELSKWQEIVQWGLVPASDDMLQFLMDRGFEDACEWAKVQGLGHGPGGRAGAAAAGDAAAAAGYGAGRGELGSGDVRLGAGAVGGLDELVQGAAAPRQWPPVV